MTPPAQSRLPLHCSNLYALTDDQLLAGRLLEAVRAALAGGCRMVQYRSKQPDHSRRLQEATQLLALCRQSQALLLINDDVALAMAVGADGVHLGQEDMPLLEARNQLGAQAIIGITCHDSLTLACAAQDNGADYVAFGRFFTSNTKQSAPPADLSVLHQARQQLHIPIVAIGGITLDNATSVLAAGADMLAVVGDLFTAADIATQARAYHDLSHFPKTSRSETSWQKNT